MLESEEEKENIDATSANNSDSSESEFMKQPATTESDSETSSSNSCSNVCEEKSRLASICVNMRTVHLLVKQNWLPQHYDSLLKFHDEIAEERPGVAPKAAKVEMKPVLNFLSGIIEAEIIAKAKSSPCIGLMCVDDDEFLHIGIYLKV